MRDRAKDKHHRKPTSTGGRNTPENISVVSRQSHRAYHILFSNMPPWEVARILTKTWIDPEYYLVSVRRDKSKEQT